MAKILVAYYSLTGNTKFIAEHIASELKADVEEIKPINDLNPNSGSKYFWGGMKATMKSKPKLEDVKFNPLDYDLIIIGSPVWAWTLSPPVRSYCSEFDLKDKKVALFTSSDGDGVKAINRFKKFMQNSDIIGEYRFISPLSKNPDQSKEKATSWAHDLMNKIQ